MEGQESFDCLSPGGIHCELFFFFFAFDQRDFLTLSSILFLHLLSILAHMPRKSYTALRGKIQRIQRQGCRYYCCPRSQRRFRYEWMGSLLRIKRRSNSLFDHHVMSIFKLIINFFSSDPCLV